MWVNLTDNETEKPCLVNMRHILDVSIGEEELGRWSLNFWRDDATNISAVFPDEKDVTKAYYDVLFGIFSNCKMIDIADDDE